MIGKFASFNSVLTPTERGRPSIYGEIVGSFQIQDTARYVDVCLGSPKIAFRTVVLIRLATFAKNRVYEIPLECLHLHDTLEEAKEHCTVY